MVCLGCCFEGPFACCPFGIRGKRCNSEAKIKLKSGIICKNAPMSVVVFDLVKSGLAAFENGYVLMLIEHCTSLFACALYEMKDSTELQKQFFSS